MALMALDIGRRELARRVTIARRAGRPLPQVVIVGAGLSGLAMAMQLVRAGHRDFLILEQSDGVGGTWRDNTYPGSGCDVPSHLYSFSFAPKCDWSRRFAEQPEILSYAEQCVAEYGLASHLRLRTTLKAATLEREPTALVTRLRCRRRQHRGHRGRHSSSSAAVSSTAPTYPSCPVSTRSSAPIGTRPAGTTPPT